MTDNKRICSHCQSGNPPDAPCCQSCGQPLPEVPASSEDDADATVHWSGTLPLPPKIAQSQAAGVEQRRTISVKLLFALKNKILIGRAAECDIKLEHPLVSRHHAALERTADGQLFLSDLGSVNGTTVDRQRLAGSTLVREAVPIGIGPFMFSLVGQSICTIDNGRSLRLDARGLEKVVPGARGQSRKILDNINLVIEPGEFVSVLGPSGSGKTTLMDCLNGRRRASGGRVLANGQDFYDHFDNFRQSLGYVPQKDIVHTQLTVGRALYYTALLRLPTDTTSKELETRMQEVIQLMELEPHRDTLVANLSGGQIKRVSLGAELLAHPCLLYIDEATSGLDAGTEMRMMKLFRNLANEGKSLICITHNVDNVDCCHLLIVLARGKLVYFGPPADALTYFGVSRTSEIYDRLQAQDPNQWEKDYAASSLYEEFVAKRQGIDVARREVGDRKSEARTPALQLSTSDIRPSTSDMSSVNLHLQELTPPPRPQHTPKWHQFRVLTQRYAELILTDKRSLRLILLQAPLIALFVLAGLIGKPFQQKILVPHVSDDEYFLLNLVQALDRDLEAADKPTNLAAAAAPANLPFRIHYRESETETVTIPYLELLQKLKNLDGPMTNKMLEKIEITLEDPKAGTTPSTKHTAAQILGMVKGHHNSDITRQLLEAHDTADITNPSNTYLLLFLISIIVLWSGCNNAAKEIVKEEAIYGRERAVNLGIVPYLASKFLVLSIFTYLQAAILMLMVYGPLHLLHAWQPWFIKHNELPASEYMLPYGEQLLVLGLLSMAGVALGLLLSACVSSPDRANTLLPYVLIPQIILGGALMPIRSGVLEWLAWLMSPEYWAYRAIRRGETTLPQILAGSRMDYDKNLWLPCLMLAAGIVALLAVSGWFLRGKDVQSRIGSP